MCRCRDACLSKGKDVPLQHQQPMWVPTNIRMHRDWKHKPFLLLPVMELKLIHPQFLHISRVHPAMTIGSLLAIQQSAKPPTRTSSNITHINIIGGKSSKYQLAGISHKPVICPPSTPQAASSNRSESICRLSVTSSIDSRDARNCDRIPTHIAASTQRLPDWLPTRALPCRGEVGLGSRLLVCSTIISSVTVFP
jgi:hypothetical protein